MFSLGPIRIILRAGTGVMLTLWMSVILARKKTFRYFSSPFALFPAISPYASFLFRNLMSHFFTHIRLQQPGCDKIRTLPAALSRAALCVCSVTDAQVMHLSFLSPFVPREGKDIEGEGGTSSVSNAPFLQPRNF